MTFSEADIQKIKFNLQNTQAYTFVLLKLLSKSPYELVAAKLDELGK